MTSEVSDKAFPLADNTRLSQTILDVVQEASNQKLIKKGANEATKALNRGIADLIILAGDTNPIEILLHLPLLCEDKNVPYIYVPSKAALGRAAQVSRNVVALAILTSENKALSSKVQALKTEIERLLIA
ncbi:ribosomal protein S6, putative [Bodo saltans]|uniref:H/ACA ribonucleoprotein complex subunit 2 n=1 Tax=Bodo saltans TaxID=75058 RepID=A0A0S4JKB4_BODSA|nr:ribosomal protein S6, putative [Bodo saltans]|eukprot:CUG90612.1 ribosomal protein S6, putative [Bodo saltans]